MNETPKTRHFKAAESGSGSLLPSTQLPPPTQQHSRVRTLSDMSHSTECDSPTDHGLRRRQSGALSIDEMSIHTMKRRHSTSSAASMSNYGARVPQHRGTSTYVHVNTKNLTIGHLIQAIVVVVVFYLVCDAHYKVGEAARRLDHYKQEEAVLIDQMDRIEDRAMQLQEQLKKLRDEHSDTGELGALKTKANTQDIHDEIYKFKREYFEVNKEVHALQDFMQDSARKELKNRYGEGAISVDLDLGLGQISVELFDESPHAAFVFVQQIENGDWSQANFIWHPANMVLASPSKAASVKLEFVERSYHHHEAWTVGLTRSHNGGYNLYVNLQDNSHVHEGDVCLGKISGGFDTLQKLMHLDTVARQPDGEKAYLDPPVAINSMAISTATRSRRN